MNKTAILTKVFLKTSFQSMSEKTMGETKKQKPRKKSFLFLYLLLAVYLIGLMGFLSYNMIQTLQQFGQEQLFLGVILLGIGFLTLIQSIFSSINLLYFTKDNEFILPLPIKPHEIVIAKTNVMLVTQYLFEIVIGLVPLTMYGILTGAGILYYGTMLVILLLFPILPMLVASFVAVIIMSFSKFMKDKNKFQLMATIFSLMMVLFITMGMNNQKDLTDEKIVQMMTSANGMVDMIDNYFPTLKPAVNALTSNQIGKSLSEIGIILFITVASYMIYIFTAQKLYLRGVVGNLYSSSKTKKKFNEKKAFKKSSLANHYIKKEVKILYRNPIFLMQCILPAIIMPVIFLGTMVPQIMNATGDPQMQELINEINKGIPQTVIVCSLLAIIQFFSMMIYISVTAISRDGQNAVFMKYIPVPLEKQLFYKAVPNVIINLFMITIVIGIAQFLIRIPIMIMILTGIVASIMAFLQSILMILVDLKKPKLQWDSEYAVVKQNINLIWPAILGMLNAMIIILVAVLFSNINPYLVGIGIGIIYTGITYLIIRYVRKNQVCLMERIF